VPLGPLKKKSNCEIEDLMMGREEAFRVATVMFSIAGQKAVWPIWDASMTTIKNKSKITMLVQIKIKHCLTTLGQYFANKHALIIRMIDLEKIEKENRQVPQLRGC